MLSVTCHKINIICCTLLPAQTRKLRHKVAIDAWDEVGETLLEGDDTQESPPVQLIGVYGPKAVNLRGKIKARICKCLFRHKLNAGFQLHTNLFLALLGNLGRS